MRVVAAEQAAQQVTSVALSIRQPTLNPTRKEPAARKWQELPVQQASLGTALSPGVVCEEVVEDAQIDELRARPVQKVCGDEVDSSEVGFDMDVDGAAGQAVGSSRAVRGLVAAAPDSPRPGSATATGETGAATTPSYTPPIMLQDVYVSISPDKERWMKAKIYRSIGTAYIIGRVYGLVKKGKNASLFQIRWLDSQFQSAVEHISVGVVLLGIKNYVALTRVKNPDWRILVRPDPTDEIDFEEDDSDCEEEVL
ncbi:hypothetical protein PI124_g6232 [Phytophthora idaei]|nr:hypothetical protein PI124_g6232 [Phytophthora idaei]